MTRKERWVPYIFLAPALLLILAFRFFPAIQGLRESMFTTSFVSNTGKVFAGLDNYKTIFSDPTFIQSVRVTILFNLIVNPVQILLALGLAMLVNQKVRGMTFFRSILLLPVAVSLNISSVVGGMAMDQAGLLNGMLTALGLPPQPFLISPNTALGSIIGLSSWVGCPFWMLFILAGMQNISHDIYESASIDGANAWTKFFDITLPLLRRSLAFVLVSDTVSNFLLFVPVFILTSGGPQLSTSTIMYEAYRRGLVYGDIGASTAMVSVLLLIVLIVIGIEFYFLRSD
jgi:multiple sugar transport system permease protein